MERKDYIFGLRAIIEALEAGQNIDKILLKRDSGTLLTRELLVIANNYNVPVLRVPVEKLDRITRKNHQGAIAVISPVVYYNLEYILPEIFEKGKNPFCIILDGITDTRNFGAIARTCDCAGVDFIIIPEKGSVSVTADAVKASAGALFHIPVCRVKSINNALKFLHESGVCVVGASEKTDKTYISVDYTVPLGIVMGAEDRGISDDALKKCDYLASIPILGKIESLNVSVAAGIFIYEVLRQRMG